MSSPLRLVRDDENDRHMQQGQCVTFLKCTVYILRCVQTHMLRGAMSQLMLFTSHCWAIHHVSNGVHRTRSLPELFIRIKCVAPLRSDSN